ncbi:MAG: hypothetical protein KKC68_06690 [Candidatus Thermoplasmatota archaeon]|nr:hypothetical protein [Candidatus Thermoplasmatota archaeon]
MKDRKLREFLGVHQMNIMCVPNKVNGESPGMLRDILKRIESLEKYLNIKYEEKPDETGFPKHSKEKL